MSSLGAKVMQPTSIQEARLNRIEIDVRSNGSELILDHDPYIDGVFLSDWIKHFDHNFIIFNKLL